MGQDDQGRGYPVGLKRLTSPCRGEVAALRAADGEVTRPARRNSFHHHFPTPRSCAFPPPLWGRVGRGVGRRRAVVDARDTPLDPHPSPSPQGGGENTQSNLVLATRLRARVLQKPFPKSPPPRRGGEAPTGAPSFGRTSGCGSGLIAARSPLGAPPRRLPRKSMPWLSPGRVSCDLRTPGVTRRTLSQSSEAPRAPVIVPAELMPRPPGSVVTNRARGNRTRSVSRPSPVTPFTERDLIR
jgi:hypothetical protein